MTVLSKVEPLEKRGLYEKWAFQKGNNATQETEINFKVGESPKDTGKRSVADSLLAVWPVVCYQVILTNIREGKRVIRKYLWCYNEGA